MKKVNISGTAKDLNTIVIQKLQHKMNTKNIALVLLSVFLILGLASALTLSGPNPSPLNLGDNQTVITLGNDQNLSENISLSVVSPTSDGLSFSVSPSTVNNLNQGQTKDITVSLTGVPSGLKFGQYSTILSAQGINSSANQTINFIKGFCKFPSQATNNNLTITRVDIKSTGKDDLTWQPLDTITVQVKVSNDGDTDMSSVYVELGVFDSNGRNAVSDLSFTSSDAEKIKVGTINHGNDKTATFEFTVPADFNDGAYRLAVKAYARSDSAGNDCVDQSSDLDNTFYQTISAEKQDQDSKLIAFDNVVVSPSQATCGDQVTVSTDAVNVGNDDQDRVKFNLVSKELGVDLSNEVTQGLNSGDNKQTSFTFTVPQGLADKIYKLELSSDYDYRSNDYHLSSDNTDVVLQVLGCNVQSNSNQIANIAASLTSSANAGQPMTISSVITNVANSTQSYVLEATGYDSWAQLSSMSDRVLTLTPGQSKAVTLNFNVNKDASGEQSFTITATSSGKTESRDVAVNIGASSSGSSFFGNNALVWVIGLINLVLIIVIIIVAVKLSRR